MIELSIIIPVYNVELYIDTCLNSIFSQNIEESMFEVIVVDDGTPDNSMSVVNKYAKLHDNLKIITQENQGLSVARNNGLNLAQGRYIWFVDSDDWLVDNSLNRVLNLLSQNDYEVYATPLLSVYEKDNHRVSDIKLAEDLVLRGKEYLYGRYPYGASQRYILKRSFYLKQNLRFYPNVLHEDGEFGPKMLFAATNVYVLSNPVYVYRIRVSGSIMSSWRKKNSDDLIIIHKHLMDFCEKNIVDVNEQVQFKDVVFNTLLVSILFAKNNWNNVDFKCFYLENISYLRFNAKQLLLSVKGIKSMIKYLLFYISPVYFVKFKYI